MKDNFFKWLFSESNRNIKLFYMTALAITAGIALITPIMTFAKQLKDLFAHINPGKLLNANLYAHCIIIFIIIISVRRIRFDKGDRLKENLSTVKEKFGFKNEGQVSTAVERAINSEIDFKQYWLWFWISLLGLYISWLFTETEIIVFDNMLLTKNIKNVSTVFFNNMGSLFLFLCYIVLSHPTFKTLDNHSLKADVNSIPYILSVLLLTILQVFLLANPNLIATDSVNKFFTGMSGILFAITLSLVIGSLDSKFMNAPTMLVALLYTYSAIQPFILMFDMDDHSLHITILYLGLLLKIVFFLFVFWLTETKRLLFYFLEVSQLFRFVNENWEEIKQHLNSNDETLSKKGGADPEDTVG